MNEKLYFLVGEKCFFNRFCDGNFKSKWNGLWSLTKKYLEYYAIKVNDNWLTKIQKSFEENLEKVTHNYEINKISIKETLFVPENEKALVVILDFENLEESEKNVNLELENAINIRNWNENWNERSYEIEYGGNYYVASCEKGKLVFYSSEVGEFIGYHFYKTHYPSNEPQRCFVTKNFSLKFSLKGNEKKKITFVFACDSDLKEAETICKNAEVLMEEKRKIYENWLKENLFYSEISYLNELFKIAVLNLKKNIVNFEGKRVFIAGYPWFTQVWGRDSFITISNCFLDEDAAKNTLSLLAKRSKDGIIPNFIFSEGIDYNSSDSSPLFVLALKNYVLKTGKIFFVEEFKNVLLQILEFYKKNKNDFGFINSPKHSTWMDTLEREGYCLEIQAFWYASLKAIGELFDLIGDTKISKESLTLARELKKNIVKHFKKEESFIDTLGKEEETINQIFLPMFEIIPLTKKFLKNIEEKFLTDVGLSTLPKNSKEYNPNSYHKGATWSHLLALLSYLQFKAGKVEEGLENLRKIYLKSNSLALSSIPEVWDSETGELIVEKTIGKEESAFIQAWSSASIIKAIDEGLLGLEYDSISKTIKVSPKIEGEFVRRIKIGEDVVTLKIIFKNASLKVDYESKLGLQYKIVGLEEI